MVGPMSPDGASPPLQRSEEPGSRRVTSADVARVSGVSRTTVSYVLNDSPGVSISAETRAHVLATAARLEYRPSAAARTLRRGRSDLVLVLLPRWVSSAVTEAFLESLESRLSVAGLTMLVYYGGARGRLAGVWRAVTPRAVISLAPFTAAERRELHQTGVQALTMGESSAEGSSDEALQERIGRMQVDYLAEAGHRRIAIATTSDKGLDEFAVPRLAGARQRCAELGLRAPTVAAVELDVEATRTVVAKWCRMRQRITAVAAYNDEVALAVLGAAHSEGIGVPDDLAIIGVDDLHAGRLVVPALTTVVQAVELEAQYLAARVLQDPAGPTQRRPSLDEYLSIIVRGSA